MARTKEKRTLKNMVVYDPVTMRFTQKGHIVHGEKVLQYPEGICEYCGDRYPKHRIKQRFCKPTCRMAWWLRELRRRHGYDSEYGMTNCVICGKEFEKTRPWSKYCSEDCRKEGIKRITAEYKQREPV